MIRYNSEAVLTNKAPLKHRLHISTPVEDTMNEHVLFGHLTDDAVRFEVKLPIVRHTDSIQFGWDMTSFG